MMNEFINDLGYNNLMIIIAIIVAIVIALIIIFIIEKVQRNRNSFDVVVEKYEPSSNVYYKDNVTEEEAKKKLDDAYEKLSNEEDELITHTNFENEQEEKSVISYDELIRVSNDIDERNDLLLKDEGTEPITIEELYKRHLEEQESENKDKLDNPVFIDDEPKKFKNSEVISPVFGVYKNVVKTKYTDEELEKTVNLEDLEVEIRKTEDFLKELKKLKNKLD